ncbi:MAG TPA: OmpA family protein, partial [Candidatus Thalassarchaeaceae archaeon]
ADYQKDTDQDGVTDDIDLCPNTDAGAEINLIGCAQNQIDSDWDGVMNDADQCPNTPFD